MTSSVGKHVQAQNSQNACGPCAASIRKQARLDKELKEGSRSVGVELSRSANRSVVLFLSSFNDDA
jgi:hypothetical protein